MNKQKETTEDMISRLAGDLAQPGEARHLGRRALQLWLICVLLMTGAAILIGWTWPDRAQLPENVLSVGFVTRSVLWLSAFFVTAALAYRSVVPLLSSRILRLVLALTLGLLTFALWSMRTEAPLLTELSREFDWDRGPCGSFIFVSGVAVACAGLAILRAGATARPRLAGVWTGLAGGTLASFFMNLLCRHETTGHVLLWHVLPIVALTLLTGQLARRLLA